ncbi:Hypothetical protein SRAE_2000437800 [Strongyloides ratti]|uniref:Uncharacterized protein n=1 Tax=Strongyloides ratti TaxID=34506 RepID=A0A090LQA9_STRRB|nr:Hypothetical protein SRAE_2000437800 [Strongyloides ratti]CEF69731.1 Hypothetical protein SRAE_2000437800 [Strongyloides ratti]
MFSSVFQTLLFAIFVIYVFGNPIKNIKNESDAVANLDYYGNGYDYAGDCDDYDDYEDYGDYYFDYDDCDEYGCDYYGSDSSNTEGSNEGSSYN